MIGEVRQDGAVQAAGRKPPRENAPSQLLSEADNQTLFALIGKRCQSLASAVVEVYGATPPNRDEWTRECCGVATFIKDNKMKSYFIRVFDIEKAALMWEQELYKQFIYKTQTTFFHTFDADQYQAGLNFSSEEEAVNFGSAIIGKLKEREDRIKQIRKQKAEQEATEKVSDNAASGIVIHHNITPKPKLPQSPKSASKGKKDKKKRLKPADIGTPTGFTQIRHLGWDPVKGFDLQTLDPDMKLLFDEAGVSDDMAKDVTISNYIRNFIEKRGGEAAVKVAAQSIKLERSQIPDGPSNLPREQYLPQTSDGRRLGPHSLSPNQQNPPKILDTEKGQPLHQSSQNNAKRPAPKPPIDQGPSPPRPNRLPPAPPKQTTTETNGVISSVDVEALPPSPRPKRSPPIPPSKPTEHTTTRDDASAFSAVDTDDLPLPPPPIIDAILPTPPICDIPPPPPLVFPIEPALPGQPETEDASANPGDDTTGACSGKNAGEQGRFTSKTEPRGAESVFDEIRNKGQSALKPASAHRFSVKRDIPKPDRPKDLWSAFKDAMDKIRPAFDPDEEDENHENEFSDEESE